MEEFTEYIYTLTDPRDKTVRYVGRTNNPQKRLYFHMKGDGSNHEKDVWIKELKSLNLMPIIEVIETIKYKIPDYSPDSERSGYRERFWMRHYQALGAPLFNKGIK